LLSSKRVGRGIPRTVTLNDDKIDYVHWDDPNELVDRLRLLEASRQVGHIVHDNEILSIIEELRKAGLIKPRDTHHLVNIKMPINKFGTSNLYVARKKRS